MIRRMRTYFLAIILASVSLCGFMCYVPDDVSPVAISEEDCLDYFRYKARINLADTVKGNVFYKNELIYSKNYCFSCEYSWGPTFNLKIFDTLSINFSVFCNNQWLESRDYKFLNRKDAFTHIDYKEQERCRTGFDMPRSLELPHHAVYRLGMPR